MPEPRIIGRRASDVRDALRQAIARLRGAKIPSDTLAAELLLMHTLGRDRAWIYSHPESAIATDDLERYFALIARRAAGEPAQYLTGKQEFWGLEFEVNPSVLIPRPETEHVVEVALERLLSGSAGADLGSKTADGKLRVADVGTGSGCIAVALAKELPNAEIVATDNSAAALEVARRNAGRHGVAGRIQFVATDLLESFHREPRIVSRQSPVTSPDSRLFDLIVSNPPYVARDESETLAREVREHEPHAALFGGPKGTEIYGRLIEEVRELLMPGGVLVLELGYDSAPRVRPLFDNDGWTRVEITNDLARIPRVIAAEKV
jgi:release factor glutamine methyltransferase